MSKEVDWLIQQLSDFRAAQKNNVGSMCVTEDAVDAKKVSEKQVL